jgi:hypothetical protein
MDYMPRFSQPFSLAEAINLDVAVITEGQFRTHRYDMRQINSYLLYQCYNRDCKAAKFFGTLERNTNHTSS